MTTDEKLREIKRMFRLRMNGVVSASMRERGANYRLNFGLTRPMLVDIATRFEPDAILAELLWQERIRESRLLAPLLYPLETFSAVRAEAWVQAIDYHELADQCCMSLFDRLPGALSFAVKWSLCDGGCLSYTGYQLMNRMLMKQVDISAVRADLLDRSRILLAGSGTLALQSVVLNFLRRVIRSGEQESREVLSVFSGWEVSGRECERMVAEELMDEYSSFWPGNNGG